MSELLTALSISTQGMRAQTTRIRVISENVANADSVANVPGAEPYRRKVVTFENALNKEIGADVVQVKKVDTDKSEFPRKYLPGQPGADDTGYVSMPNVKSAVEMMDMRVASRSYQANLNMVDMARRMANQTIGLLDR